MSGYDNLVLFFKEDEDMTWSLLLYAEARSGVALVRSFMYSTRPSLRDIEPTG